MRFERRQAAMGIRNQSNLQSRSVQSSEHIRHIVIQREVTACCPLVIDLPRRNLDGFSAPAHAFDDPFRVVDVELRVIHVVAGVQARGRGSDGAVEESTIDLDSVTRAELVIPGRLKSWSGINQREVDIEEHRAGHAAPALSLRKFCRREQRLSHGSASAVPGPAMAMAARSGWRTSAAAARTSSIVTASSTRGSRLS